MVSFLARIMLRRFQSMSQFFTVFHGIRPFLGARLILQDKDEGIHVRPLLLVFRAMLHSWMIIVVSSKQQEFGSRTRTIEPTGGHGVDGVAVGPRRNNNDEGEGNVGKSFQHGMEAVGHGVHDGFDKGRIGLETSALRVIVEGEEVAKSAKELVRVVGHTTKGGVPAVQRGGKTFGHVRSELFFQESKPVIRKRHLVSIGRTGQGFVSLHDAKDSS